MTGDEREFAQLIEALESAQRKFTDASARAQREPVYQKDEENRHTPTSMGNYRRAKAEHEAATQALIEAMEETTQATHALDAWIPQSVHERLDKGVTITAPVAGGWASLGKSESSTYYVLYASSKEGLEQKGKEYVYANPRSNQIG